MSRADIVERIRANAGRLQALGAASVGSYARDDATSQSDVDIFIDRDPLKRFSFIELTEIEFLLQDILERPVDISTRTGLHPDLSQSIQQSAIKVL